MVDLQQQLAREHEKFQSIQRIARAVGSTLDLDELLRLIVGKITELMDADRSTLYVLDEERSELWTKVLQADELREIRLNVGEGIAGWVAQSGQTVNVEDAYADPRFSPDVDRRSGYRTRSILCVPMRDIEGQTTGVVQVLNKRGGRFTEEDEDLLGALVSQASIAIENSRLYLSVVRKNQQLLRTQQALERRMRELDLLLELQQEVNQATCLDELLERLLERTIERMGVEAASILLRTDGTDRLYFRGAVGERRDAVRRLSVAMGEGVAGWVALSGDTAVVNDPASDSRHCRDLAERLSFHPRNIICVPLKGQDGVLGAIELLNKVGRDGFDTDDERLLTLVAGRAAQSIELARYRDERIKESRMAAIGQSLSGMLHDLRTPMTIISGYAQLMADNEDPAVRQEYVENIQRQFDVMSAMAKEVLAFAKGESTMLMRKVYLHKFAKEMEEHLRHEFAGKNIQLMFDARYRGVAYFDESKLRRVFHNIGRNAAQAMPGGGRFNVTIDHTPEQLLITFADTGGGIPDELEGRLFDVFATSGKRDGTGLGLAIVKKIVEDHQGEISYESTPSQGTTFTVKLPIKRSVPSQPVKPTATAA